MKYKSYSVYDDDEFFERYTQKRGKGNAPNELIEQPIVDELLGDVSGLKILDLGCGDGKYGVELLERGAAFYHGVEGSSKMISLARENLQGRPVELELGAVEEAAYQQAAYDIVISRLVLHYIEDLASIFEKVKSSLKDRGIFVFSVEHPIITSSYEAYHQKVKRGNWIVDNYFAAGERTNEWMGKEVVKYHKPLGTYWQLIRAAGFEIVELRESKPERQHFEQEEEYQRRMRIPLFLILKLKKAN